MPNEIEQLTDALRDNKACRTVSATKIDIIFENAKYYFNLSLNIMISVVESCLYLE